MRFERCLSPGFESFLMPGQPLRFLVDGAAIGPGRPLPLELQCRTDNRLMLYAGLTCVLDLRYNEASGSFGLKAHETHGLLDCVRADYQAGEAAELAADLHGYLAALHVDERHTDGEGRCQAWLSRRFGAERARAEDCAIVDTQCVIEFDDADGAEGFYAPIQQKCGEILGAMQRDPGKRFGRDVGSTAIGKKVDLILWDPAAREFIVVEVKDGTRPEGVYMSPVQVACYLAQWRKFAAEDPVGALSGLRGLLEQKMRLGLIRHECPLPEPEDVQRFRPAIVFQTPEKRSTCWGKLHDVRRLVDRMWREPVAEGQFRDVLTGLSIYEQTVSLRDVTHQYSDWGPQGRSR